MKYLVYGTVTGTKFLGEFEANSEDEAVALGLNSASNAFSLCHKCAGEFSLDEHCCINGFAETAE